MLLQQLDLWVSAALGVVLALCLSLLLFVFHTVRSLPALEKASEMGKGGGAAQR